MMEPQTFAEPVRRRSMRKHYIFLTAIVLVLVGAIGATWWKMNHRYSETNVTAEAVQAANNAVRATGRTPDAPATEGAAHVSQCDNGMGGYSGHNAWISLSVSNVTSTDASQMASAFDTYLHHSGFGKIETMRTGADIRVSGLKGDVLVELVYSPADNNHLVRVNATAGCPA